VPRQTSQEIDDEAAAWAARVDRGPLSVDDERALAAWLDGDIRRVGAYARTYGLSLHTERARALGADFDPQQFEAPPRATRPPTRRGLLWLCGGAVAASAAGLTALGVLRTGWTRFNTRKGEMRVVPLEDGSVMTLNTASEVAVRFTRERRELRLTQGEVLFDVAKDPARPFVVAAADTSVRAVGTSFTVRRLGERPVQVLVREGVVEVRQRSEPATKAVRIAANNRLVARNTGTAGAEVSAVPPKEMSRELSWREGRIAFQGETLSQAAEEFSRYSSTRIVIDDPALAREGIAGLFQANDPVGFAQAVAASLDVKVQVGPDQVRLYR
jgi:transmembrane sensor